MWREYHEIRTSDVFKGQWKVFLEGAGQVDVPTFYQYVSNELFKEIIKYKHCTEIQESEDSQEMTLQDKNVCV